MTVCSTEGSLLLCQYSLVPTPCNLHLCLLRQPGHPAAMLTQACVCT